MVNPVYLLDTNAISEPLRPSPNAHLMRRVQEYEGQIAIAAIVWHELLYGCWRLPQSRKREVIEHYLFDVVRPTIPILDYDAQAAQWHAGERARLMRLGQPPSFTDGQIAAIAVVHNLTLVTANTADFAHFDGLSVENWLAD